MTATNAADWVVNDSERRSRLDLQLAQLWRHRELAFFFALRDVRVRYKQALLGGAWAVLQPLVGALTFTIVFNRVANIEVEGTSYFAFVIVGTVAWNYVSTAINNGTSSLLYNGELLTKVSFPRLVLPIAAALPGLLDLTIGLVVAFVASLVTGGSLSAVSVLVALPLGLVLLVVGAIGPMLYLSAKVVKYRDVMVLVGFGLQVMLFLTPIAYPVSQLPEAWQTVAYINPAAGAVGLLRVGVIDSTAPTVGQLGISAGVALVILVLSLLSFRAHEREFADVI
ncbi:MAG: ABC transporter permease [Actinomycetota bacterium]|nr:ABC transporter permease [Actinomycetota bacterium]